MSNQKNFHPLADNENDEPTAVIARATLLAYEERPVSKKQQPAAVAAVSTGALMKLPQLPLEKGKSSNPGQGDGFAREGHGSHVVYNNLERDGLSRAAASQCKISKGSGLYSNCNLSNNCEQNEVSHRRHNFSKNLEQNDISHGSGGRGYNTIDGAFGGGHGPDYGLKKVSRGNGENWPLYHNQGRGHRSGHGRDRISGKGYEHPHQHRPRTGTEVNQDGSSKGNWRAEADESSHQEAVEKAVLEVDDKSTEIEHQMPGGALAHKGLEEEENTELTLDEYEKILKEKRKALLACKGEERKVLVDKAFESMQLVEKRNEENGLIKVGSEKERKNEALQEKQEKTSKTQSINQFLKAVDGENFFAFPSGRGHGRSGESCGGDGKRQGNGSARNRLGAGKSNKQGVSVPLIEDLGQFPTLGPK